MYEYVNMQTWKWQKHTELNQDKTVCLTFNAKKVTKVGISLIFLLGHLMNKLPFKTIQFMNAVDGVVPEPYNLRLHRVSLKLLRELWTKDTSFLVYYSLKSIKNGCGDEISFL